MVPPVFIGHQQQLNQINNNTRRTIRYDIKQQTLVTTLFRKGITMSSMTLNIAGTEEDIDFTILKGRDAIRAAQDRGVLFMETEPEISSQIYPYTCIREYVSLCGRYGFTVGDGVLRADYHPQGYRQCRPMLCA